MISQNDQFDFYILVWEEYNKALDLETFESKITKSLSDFAKNDIGEYFVPILKEFFSKKNTKLTSINEDIFFKKEIQNINDNIYVDFMVKKMSTLNNVFLELDGKQNTFFITEHISKTLLLHLKSYGLDKKEMIETIKSAIRKKLELGAKDAVFFTSGKFLVKVFVANETDKRFGGMVSAELEQLKNRYQEEFLKDAVLKATDDVLVSDLNLKRTNNVNFHQGFLKLVEKQISQKFARDFLKDQQLLHSFSAFLMRVFFDDILLRAVEQILDLASAENSNIKNFINFYDGKEIYIENNLIEKPVIKLDGENQNYFSVNNLLKERQKNLEIYEKEKLPSDKSVFFIKRLEDLKESLQKQKNSIDDLINPDTESKEYKLLETDINIMDKEISKLNAKLFKQKEALSPFENAFLSLDKKLQELKLVFVENFKNFRL